MEEPKRIGLTASTSAKLDELLEHMNPEKAKEGVNLIKFDLYRLAVAIGIKRAVVPPELSEKSNTSFRVSELDEDSVLFTTLDNLDLVPEGLPIYSFIERLAEEGVSEFYEAYQQTGELPLEDYFEV